MTVFERPGPVNTDAVIRVIKEKSTPPDFIIAASITGESALKLSGELPGRRIICVTCPQGMYWEVGQMENDLFNDIAELREIRDEWKRKGLKRVPMNITDENLALLKKRDIPVIRGTIPLFGPSFSMRLHLNQITSLDIMAKTLELFSTGTLVGLECALMAVDAGILPEGINVISCAGTERGLDTAWIIRTCASSNIFHPSKGFRFIELLAKPGISSIPDIGIKYLR